jgi:hypothetical protein
VEQVGVEAQEAGVPVGAAPVDAAFDDTGFVEFAAAGSSVSGEFRCADCGYGAVVQRVLPQCPMCGGAVWESRGPLRALRRPD